MIVPALQDSEIDHKSVLALQSSELIDQKIAENRVMMFSKSSCPHCTKAKQTLKAKNIEFEVLELDLMTPRGSGAEV